MIRSSVPITRSLDWWSIFNYEINDLKVKIFHKQHSILEATLKGHIKSPESGWKPFIQKLHISERFILHDLNGQAAEMELFPVVITKKDSTYEANQIIPFELNVQIEAKKWKHGENNIQIKSKNCCAYVVLL